MGRRKAAGTIREVARRDAVESWERRPLPEPRRTKMMKLKAAEKDQHYIQLRSDIKGQPVLRGLGLRWLDVGAKKPAVLEVDFGNRADRETHTTLPRKQIKFVAGRPRAYSVEDAGYILFRYGEYLEEVFPDEE